MAVPRVARQSEAWRAAIRANTDRFKEQHELRHTIASLLEKLPADLKKFPEIKLLSSRASSKVYNIVHLIYHNTSYEGYSKDF